MGMWTIKCLMSTMIEIIAEMIVEMIVAMRLLQGHSVFMLFLLIIRVAMNG